jgi:CheY-like chemotaxis protein
MKHERGPVALAGLLAETERLLRLTLPRSIPLATRAEPAAVVHGTITSLGGVVRPESAPGRGTTMRLLLPLADASADAALERLAAPEAAYDCLLTDLSMPGQSGLELADAARALVPSLPVVLATGFLDADASRTPASGRVDAVLTKPFSSEELRRTLDAVVPT